jgi:flagellar protein FlbD
VIKVTRFDGSELIVNCELVESVEQTPDTVLSFVGGKKLLVKEGAAEIIERVVQYKRSILQPSLCASNF